MTITITLLRLCRKALQKFSETVRDETDLDKLTGELVNVVQETMQPKSVSVWLKTTHDGGRKTNASSSSLVVRPSSD